MTEQKDIPKHWQIKKLGEVCEVIMGQSPPSETYNTNGNGLPFFQGKAEFTDMYPVAEKWCSIPNKLAEPYDILLSVRAPVGSVNISNQKCCIGRGLAAIRYSNYKYIYFFLKNIEKELDKKGTGTTFKAISGETIRNTFIPLPPLPEQLTIVSRIEELLSDLENGKQQLLTAQQQLKVYRQSLLKAAFEGKLTNKEVKDGELPKGWKIVQISDIIDKGKHALKAGPFGSSLKKEFYVKEGYKIYGQEQVISDDAFLGDYYINEEKYQQLQTCKIKPFDILISLVGTVGKVLILPQNCKEGVINPRLIKITLNKEVYLHKFFKYYFESSYVKNFYGSKAQGTTMDVLNLGIIKTIPFPLPNIEEQQLIVSELESKLTVCDKIEETISQSLQQSETLRQSILKKAFEGRLV
jgi:type I restriction enzyme S subunit